MVRAAVRDLLRKVPVPHQDRWEENAGLSPDRADRGAGDPVRREVGRRKPFEHAGLIGPERPAALQRENARTAAPEGGALSVPMRQLWASESIPPETFRAM